MTPQQAVSTLVNAVDMALSLHTRNGGPPMNDKVDGMRDELRAAEQVLNRVPEDDLFPDLDDIEGIKQENVRSIDDIRSEVQSQGRYPETSESSKADDLAPDLA